MLRRNARLLCDISKTNEDSISRCDTRDTIISSYAHEIEWKWRSNTMSDECLFERKLYCRVRISRLISKEQAISNSMHYEQIQSAVDHSSREWDFDEKWSDFWQRFDCIEQVSSYDVKKMRRVKKKERWEEVANSEIFDIVRSHSIFHYIIQFTIHNSQYWNTSSVEIILM